MNARVKPTLKEAAKSYMRALTPWRIVLAIVLVFSAIFVLSMRPSGAQVDKPIFAVTGDTIAFSMAADNRVAYVVRKQVHVKPYDLEHDDIFLTSFGGKKTRLAGVQKSAKDAVPFSYSVRSMTWSPDGHRITVEADTLEVSDAHSPPRESVKAFLLNDTDHDVDMESLRGAALDGAWQAAWLADGATVVYLTEVEKPRRRWQINMVHPGGAHAQALFDGHTYAGVAWDAPRNTAIAIEADADSRGPLKLVRLDLLQQTRRELGTVIGYADQLTVSPSGKRVAWYRDRENIEVRDVDSPAQGTVVHIPYGHYEWGPDENEFLVKSGEEKESGEIFWVRIADSQMQSTLHGLVFGDFQISADGKYLGVFNPGRFGFQIISLPAAQW
jgi:hypothetical protein